ncbi:MAG: glycosyltransferase family 9 protein [Thermodesulfobacteriota bacterium]
MSEKPVLILQMQRMGDIVLSFPLFLWMRRNRPGRPVWVVAERTFYDQLMDVSPGVVYLPWTATGELSSRDYSLIVNLSHRPEAAALAGSLEAPLKIGPVRQGDALNINGRWQLYRASLTGNNRHNRFHWAELNALDCVDPGVFGATGFDPPRDLPGDNMSVGLFLGASQREKRPDPPFWAALAGELERRGAKPVLMGGPAEVPLGEEVRRLHGGRLVDTCGKLGLREFMAVGQTLSLLVTPDTGPMHLAAWSGLKTLNLSMGPVNPWETGPFQPGHYVLRASMSCLDCWQCRFGEPRCRGRFDPAQVAYLSWRLARGGGRFTPPPGTRLFRTGRTREGFYDLVPVGARVRRAPDILAEMWRGAFGAFFGLWDESRPHREWETLVNEFPRLREKFLRGVALLAGKIRDAVVTGVMPGDEFWKSAPPMLRPLAGYIHMHLENADFSRPALAESLAMIERLRSILA